MTADAARLSPSRGNLPALSDALLAELEAMYKDIHAHPELSMQEKRTAGIAAAWLFTVFPVIVYDKCRALWRWLTAPAHRLDAGLGSGQHGIDNGLDSGISHRAGSRLSGPQKRLSLRATSHQRPN